MSHRRLVGIDLGIATTHMVRVLDGEGNDRGQPQGLAHPRRREQGRYPALSGRWRGPGVSRARRGTYPSSLSGPRP